MLDELTSRLNRAAEDAARSVRLTSAHRVRATAQRDRVRAAAVTSTTLGVVAIASGVMLGHGLSADRSPGAPAYGLVMPHEGEQGWTRSDDPDTRAAFAGCGDKDPTLAGRTSAITMTGPGNPGEESHSPTRLTEQVFFFDSKHSATAALAALHDAVTPCGWIDPRMGVAVSGSRLTDSREERFQAVQQSTAIVLVHASTGGALMSSGGLNDLPEIQRRLCSVSGMCPIDPGPMSPRPSGAATPEPSHGSTASPGGTAWPS
jgi:hypothetical protein